LNYRWNECYAKLAPARRWECHYIGLVSNYHQKGGKIKAKKKLIKDKLRDRNPKFEIEKNLSF